MLRANGAYYKGSLPFFFGRDDLLSGLAKLDEHLDTYLASVMQVKSVDSALDELKDQHQTLEAAISNPQHPLHSVQAKYVIHSRLLIFAAYLLDRTVLL